MLVKFWLEGLTGVDHSGIPDVDRRTILKRSFHKLKMNIGSCLSLLVVSGRGGVALVGVCERGDDLMKLRVQ